MIEREVDLKTPDGVMKTFVFHPEEGGPFPIVLYLMDAPSIRPALKDMASRLGTAGYYVMLPYLFYRGGPFREFGMSDEDMHRRRELMATVTRGGIEKDAAALLAHADADPSAQSNAKVGAVGFCMSGALVLHLAQTLPERVAAGACLHGGGYVRDRDNSPHRQLDRIKAELYFGWPGNDPGATEDDLKIMKEATRAAGIKAVFDFFPDALHGFAPQGGQRYDRYASEKHWERVHSLMRRNLTECVFAQM